MIRKSPFYNLVLMTCLIIGGIGIFGNISAAQEQPDEEDIPQQRIGYEFHMGTRNGNFLANPYYEHYTRQLIKNIPNFDYERYRVQYATSRGYDPMGDKAREKLLSIAYTIQNDEDPEVVEEALKEYKSHIRTHLANISVVMMAMNLAEEDKRFGNPKFFARIRNGLFASVKEFGNGRSLNTAYSVVTMAEETMLLDSLGYKINGTSSQHSGMLYFNMHAAEDLKTGRRYTIFVDITKPMSHLKQQQEFKNRGEATFAIR